MKLISWWAAGTLALVVGAPAAAAEVSAPPSPAAAAAVATVRTSLGYVGGRVDADGIVSFKGVPFARPPVGRLRWTAAAPARGWSGVRDAGAFGPACLQRTRLSAQETAASGAAPEKTSEDCLTLNIWAPARVAAPLPVMVWLHGGGHTSGSGSLAFYDGSSFARDGVILVTVNYRLGPLGYFAHPALTRAAGAEGPLASYGTTDQIAALRWVQRNARAFGGDPGQVTVFGESAGAQSVLTLLATPAAKGLFARAIAQSAYVSGKFPTLAEAEATGSGLASKVGLSGAEATAEQLRAVPGDALVAAAEKLPFGPIVDGRLLPDAPARVIARGEAIRAPLMIGTNSDEGSLVGARDAAAVLSEGQGSLVERARAAYGPGAENDKTLARKLWRDWTFTAPARWTARKLSAAQPVYLYRYDYTPERLRKVWDGVPHGYEVPFVFDSLARTPQYAALVTTADKAAIAVIHACWVSFAKTGRPDCPGGPPWPAYDPGADAEMEFGLQNQIRVRRDAGLLDAVEAQLTASGKLAP